MSDLRIRVPDDFHVHLREGSMMQSVLPYTARVFARATVMPNTSQPILNAKDAMRYRGEIKAHAPKSFTPLMTIKIVPQTTSTTILEAFHAGVTAAKLYPEGMTTNSDDGVRNYHDIFPVFEAMQNLDMLLLLHGENPASEFACRAEGDFLPTLREIASAFPKLRIVLEHVSSAEGIKAVLSLPDQVAATVTVHHLFITERMVMRPRFKPHLFCMPIAKSSEDREALIKVVTTGNPKFFLGTDSAPHMQQTKEAAECCAGCFTAPIAMPLLAQLFEERGALRMLEGFTSQFGAEHYKIPLNTGHLTLQKTSMTVSRWIDGVIPFKAGETIDWSMVV